MAAIERADFVPLVEPLFEKRPITNGKATRNVHAFSILSQILREERFKPRHSFSFSRETIFQAILENHGDALLAVGLRWSLNANDAAEVEKKIEELQWLVTIMFAAPKVDDPVADFVLYAPLFLLPFIATLLTFLSSRIVDGTGRFREARNCRARRP